MDELEQAVGIAREAHSGATDKVGNDYFLHPLAVSGLCISPRAKIAAILHDVIEDTPITKSFLLQQGIGEDVVYAVDCLSRRDGDTIDQYYGRIITSDIAIEVKFCDIRHNSDRDRWPASMKNAAQQNYEKYAFRAKHLLQLVGRQKAKKLLSKDTFSWLMGLNNQ